MSTIKLKLASPRFPNYIALITSKKTSIEDMRVDISELNDEELEEYAEKWKLELIAHAKKRRTQ